AHHARQAEPALEPTANLRGDAESQAVVVRHEHRADPARVAQPEDELPAAVLGGRDTLGLRDLDGRPFGQPRPEVLRKIAHRREVDLTLPVDPRRELAPAVSRRAQLDGEIFELAWEETDHVHARHRWKNTTSDRAAIFPHDVAHERGRSPPKR